MKRDDVLKTIKDIGRDVSPDLDWDRLDTKKRYDELGLESLDLVAILTRSMKALKIRVPSTDLADVKTTDDLLSVLCSAGGVKKQA
jgi:acyl carrier protein